jgi:hypothetical protein
MLPRFHRHRDGVSMTAQGLKAAAVAVALMASAPAEACKCFTEKTPDEEYAAIFEGRVVSREELLTEADPYRPRRHQYIRTCFDVVDVTRGSVPSRVCVATGMGNGDCGFTFVPGRSYRVFARDGNPFFAPEVLSTGICDRTIELGDPLFRLWSVSAAVAALGALLWVARRVRSHPRAA